MSEKLVTMVENLCTCGHDETQHHRSNSSVVTGGCVTLTDKDAYCDCEQFEAILALTAALGEYQGSLKIESAQKMCLSFDDSRGEIGKFFVNDDRQLDFVGDATESARAFVRQCKEMWDEIPVPDQNFKETPLYCAICGTDVKRGGIDGQYYFGCDCPQRKIPCDFPLLTTDVNEHRKRKQLKS